MSTWRKSDKCIPMIFSQDSLFFPWSYRMLRKEMPKYSIIENSLRHVFLMNWYDFNASYDKDCSTCLTAPCFYISSHNKRCSGNILAYKLGLASCQQRQLLLFTFKSIVSAFFSHPDERLSAVCKVSREL